MKRMHDYAPEHHPSEEERKEMRNGAGLVTLLVMFVLVFELFLVIGPFAFIVGPILAIAFGVWLYEWMKANRADRNYRRALARQQAEQETRQAREE